MESGLAWAAVGEVLRSGAVWPVELEGSGEQGHPVAVVFRIPSAAGAGRGKAVASLAQEPCCLPLARQGWLGQRPGLSGFPHDHGVDLRVP